jgi:hypothetical protein
MKKLSIIIDHIIIILMTGCTLLFFSGCPAAMGSPGGTADPTAPLPGDSGTLSISSIDASSVALSWTKATDDTDAEADLQYKVVRSSSSNIGTVDNAEANGTVAADWTADTASFSESGLTAGDAYYYNVLVKDSDGLKAAYSQLYTGGHTVSGTIKNGDTGAPLQGVTFKLGPYIETTASDGTYSFILPKGVESVTGDMYVYISPDYDFQIEMNHTLSATSDVTRDFYIDPTSPGTLQDINSLVIKDDTGNEIADGISVYGLIQNSAGGRYDFGPYSYQAGGISMTDALDTYGPDCTLVVLIADSTGFFLDWYYIEEGVDTSSGLTITVDKSAHSADYKSVTVSGSTGDTFVCHHRYSSELTVEFYGGISSGSSTAFEIYDPLGSEFLWGKNMQTTFEDPDGYNTYLIDMLGSTQTMSDGDTVTLPTPSITPPADNADASTAAYTVNGDGTATITFPGVSGADSYSLGFEDESGSSACLGNISGVLPPDSGTTVSVELIADFVTDVLEAGAGWDVTLDAISVDASGSVEIDYSQMRGSQDTVGFPPGLGIYMRSDDDNTGGDADTSVAVDLIP